MPDDPKKCHQSVTPEVEPSPESDRQRESDDLLAASVKASRSIVLSDRTIALIHNGVVMGSVVVTPDDTPSRRWTDADRLCRSEGQCQYVEALAIHAIQSGVGPSMASDHFPATIRQINAIMMDRYGESLSAKRVDGLMAQLFSRPGRAAKRHELVVVDRTGYRHDPENPGVSSRYLATGLLAVLGGERGERPERAERPTRRPGRTTWRGRTTYWRHLKPRFLERIDRQWTFIVGPHSGESVEQVIEFDRDYILKILEISNIRVPEWRAINTALGAYFARTVKQPERLSLVV